MTNKYIDTEMFIGDKNYEVINPEYYGVGAGMNRVEIRVEALMLKPGQKVKVIIVEDE